MQRVVGSLTSHHRDISGQAFEGTKTVVVRETRQRHALSSPQRILIKVHSSPFLSIGHQSDWHVMWTFTPIHKVSGTLHFSSRRSSRVIKVERLIQKSLTKWPCLERRKANLESRSLSIFSKASMPVEASGPTIKTSSLFVGSIMPLSSERFSDCRFSEARSK